MSEQNSDFDFESIQKSLQGPFYTAPSKAMADAESFIEWVESLPDEP